MMLDALKFTSAITELVNSREPVCAYLYDLNSLSCHAAHIRKTLAKNIDFFYAIKANSDIPILSTLAEWVDGFEASSGGEIQWVRSHFPHIPLIFSGPGKLDSELELAVLNNVTVHVESLYELERLSYIANSLNRQVSILLRVNPYMEELKVTSLVMGGKPTQFGIGIEHLSHCLQLIKRNAGHLVFQGFHFHLLSHQLDARQHLLLLSAYIRQAKEWGREFDLSIKQINVGGGIGINYRALDQQFDWAVFAEGVNQLQSSNEDSLFQPRIRFEFGRYITGFCGAYAAEVIDVKTSGDRAYVVVKGGTHHFRTPYAQGHSHPFSIIPVSTWDKPYPRPEVKARTVTVVGQLCTPKDVLATNAMVDQIRVGDIVLFSHAGAYAWHISHHDFLRHAHPQHIYFP